MLNTLQLFLDCIPWAVEGGDDPHFLQGTLIVIEQYF